MLEERRQQLIFVTEIQGERSILPNSGEETSKRVNDKRPSANFPVKGMG